MAKDLSNAPNIGSDANYLNGNVVNDQTIIGEHINQDMIQFFQKLMSLANLTPNGSFDNETNGYQFIEALNKLYQQKSIITILQDTANGIVKYTAIGNDTDGYIITVYVRMDAGASATITTNALPTKYRPAAKVPEYTETPDGDTFMEVRTNGTIQYQNAFPSDEVIISATYHTEI